MADLTEETIRRALIHTLGYWSSEAFDRWLTEERAAARRELTSPSGAPS